MSTGQMEITSTTRTARFLGRCDTCDRPVAAIVENATTDHTPIACPDCGTPCDAQRLYGTTTVAHCNGACEGARGPTCKCACGGVNHGGAWERPGSMLADQLAAYRADRARHTARAEKRRTTAAAARQEAKTLWATTHADVVGYLTNGDIAWNDFLCELADQLDERGELTDPQVVAVRRNLARQVERDARRAAEATLPTCPVVTGKAIEVTGEVVKVAVKENDYGTRLVMTVRDDRGFWVWGTVPGSLDDTIHADFERFGEGHWTGVGARVQFVAAITVSADDETFGYFKRPRKAAVLAETAAAA